jgi:hypothetical protein
MAPRRPTACNFSRTMSRIISSGSRCARAAERDVLEDIEVGEQRAALEQHAHLLAGVEQVAARQRGRFWPLTQTSPLEAQLRAHQAQQRGLATPDGPMMPVTLPRGCGYRRY